MEAPAPRKKSVKSDFKSEKSARPVADLQLRHQRILWRLRIFIFLAPVFLLGHLITKTLYQDEFIPIIPKDPYFENVQVSPDGQRLVVVAASTENLSTIFLSEDGGETWEQDLAGLINDFSVNWNTGECIGASYRYPDVAADTTALDTTAIEPAASSYNMEGRRDIFKLTSASGIDTTNYHPILIWKSDDFGRTRTELHLHDSNVSRNTLLISMDWATGNAVLRANPDLYTMNFGNSWSSERPVNFSVTSEESYLTVQKIPYADDSIYIKARLNPTISYGAAINFTNKGEGNTLFLTDDGGKTWREQLVIAKQKQPGIYEQRIFWFAVLSWCCIAAIAYLLYARRRIRKELVALEKPSESSLAMMSDNPSDEDKLGFENTVEAILKVLKNPDSKPPVTIALSGKWGSGKSSLMAQVRKKLMADKRFVTLWFNVWHFQSEDHMLASFLSSILQTFEKSFGPLFRFRLFKNRLVRLSFFKKVAFYLGMLIVFPVLFYLLLHLKPFDTIIPVLRAMPAMETFFSTMDSIGVTIATLFDSSKETGGAGENIKVPVVSVIVWIIGALFLKQEWFPSGLAAFFQLIPLDKFKMEAVKQDPGFREKYKKEFWEILEAAGDDKRYVVFIDDLDRINGSRLRDLLEGINFISDTASKPSELIHAKANIFFVLGMSVEEVVRNLGRELNTNANSGLADAVIGANYMQKLVDLVVQVPGIEGCTKAQLQTIMIRPEDVSDNRNLA